VRADLGDVALLTGGVAVFVSLAAIAGDDRVLRELAQCRDRRAPLLSIREKHRVIFSRYRQACSELGRMTVPCALGSERTASVALYFLPRFIVLSIFRRELRAEGEEPEISAALARVRDSSE